MLFEIFAWLMVDLGYSQSRGWTNTPPEPWADMNGELHRAMHLPYRKRPADECDEADR